MKKTLLLLLLAPLSLCASEFPVPYNSEPDKSNAMPATEAAAKLRLPPGFKATVFAAEPDVQNPFAMPWDARGRLWVAENYTYAERARKFDLNLLERGEIAVVRESALSLMPEGLLEALTAEQARDLIAYLMHKSQVPMPAAGNSSSN